MYIFNEVIKDILEINLKVKTDNDKERNISFSNFKKPKCPSVDIYSDKSIENPIKQIKINMDCDGFDLCITENDGWIPVSERLPKCIEGSNMSDFVLCTVEYLGDSEPMIITSFVFYCDEKGEWYHNNESQKVTAWMPLPKPYSKISS
jgi:hypothetical protein